MAQYPKGEPLIPVYPELEEKGSFSMIMVPDPQCYVKFEANQPLFDLQTAWIAQNIQRLNIKAALFTGDMGGRDRRLFRHKDSDLSCILWIQSITLFLNLQFKIVRLKKGRDCDTLRS